MLYSTSLPEGVIITGSLAMFAEEKSVFCLRKVGGKVGDDFADERVQPLMSWNLQHEAVPRRNNREGFR